MDSEIWILVAFFCINTVYGQNNEVLRPTDFEENATLTIDCEAKPAKINTTNTQNLNINCSNPNINYSKLLSTFKIEKLKTLRLFIHPPNDGFDYTLSEGQFSNLNVDNLILDYNFKNTTGMETFMRLSSDFIYVLDRVKLVQLKGFLLIPNLKDPDANTTQCTIQSLTIITSDLRNITSGWLKPCKTLIQLHVSKLRQRNGTKEVRRKLLAGLNNLKELEIHECYIEELNDEMEDLTGLQKLDVAHNQIHYALTTTVLPALEELDLSYNHIYASSLFSTGVERQSKLRAVSLDYNKVLNMCDELDYRTTNNGEAEWHTPLSGRYISLPLVRRFSLRGTITTTMCFGNMYMDSLEYFDVSDSRIQNIHFKALPRTKSRRLEINVAGCPITDIPPASFTEDNYKSLYHEELRISGLNLTLDCDCDQHFWLARAVRERRLLLDRVTCSSHEDFALVSSLSVERLNCTKYKCGACTCRRYWQTKDHACDECVCKRYWKDNSTDVECSGELHAIPKEPGLRRLYAAGNLVSIISAGDIPDTLIYLDLVENHIARMSPEAAVALFKNKQMKIRLQGNPIICDCKNKEFILQLMDHFDQVEDYNLLQCVDGEFIRNVEPGDLCFTSSKIFTRYVLGMVGGALGLLALCGGLYYRYSHSLKVLLYARGLCLCCIKEEDVDAERPFDAFVSFSHKDFDFVKDHLLPGLENAPYHYKICVHFRNWMAGELIPTQIDRSVEESKRTIIVLSNNFVESIWGLLEFRTAHLSALKEGRSRVIIIILDDIINDENLDGELRSYLKMNTYVKWGDPWFWDILRYALPHRANVERNENVSVSRQQLSSGIGARGADSTVSTDSAIEMEQMSSGALNQEIAQ